MTSYERGKLWALNVFRKNYAEGMIGVFENERIKKGCTHIFRTKMKDGRKITDDEISFYWGALDGIREFELNLHLKKRANGTN